MKIYCKKCKKHIGNIEPGSELSPGIIFICRKCYPKKSNPIPKAKPTPRVDDLDFLRGIMGLK